MKTILVIDDSAMYRESIAAVLIQEGYCALTATNGCDALSILQSVTPNLILLDVAMPEMDGLTFISHFYRENERRNIPNILLTAVCEKDYLAQARKLGVREYFIKSYFSLENILAEVEKYIGPGNLPQKKVLPNSFL